MLFVRYFLLWIAQSIVLGILVMPMMALYRRIFPPLDILEIHGRYQNEMFRKINYIKYKYHISEALHYEEIGRSALIDRIKAHEAVLINDLPADERNDIVKICFDIDKRVYTVPKISDIILKSSEDLNLLDTPLFLNRNMGMSDGQSMLKRFLDVLCSVMALVVLSPVLLITAILIRREDGGPVFYRQERCTENGRVFRILKFRSMIVDAEKDGKSRPAVENDDRITKVGRVIRAWRIDELPQLVNILRGDMSIVGPRPERVEHVEKYTKEIPEFRYRMKVKGGLTGYAQVYGKYNTSALDKLKLDLMYITNYSIITDIQIVFETVKILFLKESTEGFHSSGVLTEPVELREGPVGGE